MENPLDKKGHKTTYTCPHTAKRRLKHSKRVNMRTVFGSEFQTAGVEHR